MANILLVEDDVPLREAYGFILRADGHTVTAAGNGKEGIAAAKSGEFEIILLDLHMPVMDGWDFLHEYRSLGTADTRVIVFSNNVDDETALRAKKLGAHQAVLKSSMKPSSMLDLIHSLTLSSQK